VEGNPNIFRALIKKYGARRITVAASLFSAIVATGLASILDIALKGHIPVEDVFISFSIAVILAPMVTFGFIHLSQQLDTAEGQMSSMAAEDFLTKTLNRRHFMKVAEMELDRAKRYKHPMTLMIIDADNFKVINDTHGHAVGDEVLRKLADICKASLRKSDILGRYGGEEFVILLPETPKKWGKIVAERIRESLQNASIKTSTNATVVFTVSIGLSGSDKEFISLNKLMSAADKALYLAKKQGRNRVAIAA